MLLPARASSVAFSALSSIHVECTSIMLPPALYLTTSSVILRCPSPRSCPSDVKCPTLHVWPPSQVPMRSLRTQSPHLFMSVLADTHVHAECQWLSTSLRTHAECPSQVCTQHPLCALPIKTKRKLQAPEMYPCHRNLHMLTVVQSQRREWPKSQLWTRANLGSTSGSAASSLYGLRQVHLPPCAQCSHKCKGNDPVQSPGAAVRIKRDEAGGSHAQELCSLSACLCLDGQR